jgi:hypothetical protein
MPRPFFNKTTKELTQLFADCGNSPDTLQKIADELAYRRVPSAVELRNKVEAALAGAIQPAREPELGFQPTSILPPRDHPDGGSATKDTQTQRREKAADYATPPMEFTTIQPVGVRNRPNAFRPELQNDVLLESGANDAPVKVFRVALFALIREMRARRIGNKQFTLEEGERLNIESGGFSYQFEFTEEANLFEGAKVDIIIGGRSVSGHVTALLPGRIIVTVQDDFGPLIKMCVLRIDNTALLQALHDRLQKIEVGEVSAFRAEFAGNVLRNAGKPNPSLPITRWPVGKQPNDRQRNFVGLALANEISWLWGPPGTGKTDTLSALVRILYEQGKRILICSNTNQAVDQLLFQLCENMNNAGEPALADGRVLRLGFIAHAELKSAFEKFITLDAIVARKSEALIARKAEVEGELQRLSRDVACAEQILSKFSAFESAQAAMIAADKEAALLTNKAQCSSASLRICAAQRATLEQELDQRFEASAIRRIFLRNEAAIRQDIAAKRSEQTILEQQLAADVQRVEQQRGNIANAITERARASAAVSGEDKAKSARLVAEYEKQRQPLQNELAAIAAKLEDIKNSILKDARIVGATVTRTYLRPLEFVAFDVVIIDEASMILQPAVFHAAGLAIERVIIAGDFQQLPPIVQTEQQAIYDALVPDVFERAGINHETVSARTAPRVEMLTEQFRMDESICRLVSGVFYDGNLFTSQERTQKNFDLPAPFTHRLTIVDTSRVWPFTTRDAFNSRLNLMHALAIRNLMFHLHEHGCVYDSEGKGAVGVCTPYSAQAKLIQTILKAHGFEKVRASTAHGFQGDERKVLVLDLVDSVGERNAGYFLQATQLRDSGAKLFNVALSRAKEAIVVFANLTFLDQKLPGDSILRGLLYDMQRTGGIIDVHDVLALHPIVEDLQRFGPQPELEPEALRTGLFGGRDFARLVRYDIEAAAKSIVIFSGFITATRAAQMGDVLRRKVMDGVQVRCVTRPPRRNGSIAEEEGRTALKSLETIGAAVNLRNDIHEKVVLIDNRVVWFGSLNPLSHTMKTSEVMARIDNEGVAAHLANVLATRKRTPEELERGAGAMPENPRCEKCGNWSVLVRGKFGPFFKCESAGCDWKQNVDAVRGTSRRAGQSRRK